MEIIEEIKKRFDWSSLLVSALLIALGVCILIWPNESSNILIYIVAGLITLAGLIFTVLYFTRHERVAPFVFGGLSAGLTLLAIGILLLLRPEILKLILPVMLGILLVFSGFGSLQTAVELMRLKVQRWYIPLIFAAVAITCGIIALLRPFGTAAALMIFLGIALLGEGIMLMVSLFLFQKNLK